ncbi:SusC/RagA family TonB-linked outer membrane protein [Tenacibaculum sp. 1B UA]|uniref:SusC/RagA family TonB-linked outer membrane protein n=1 Tax=Tenacibaculum sp. 1B UA TaxID=2922252 RepID=UPI002A24A877|nr:SusC/RagA family TonB-linked outer membrane protein [Tenacibaculum sp. 1B UA]MDX8553201.1 SusC/RagA family TonB-linked outer membrane protein [Tenacibaculum sp. 1B UA]
MKTKFNGILTLLLALIVQMSFAQEKVISGTVSDETGPLPGVNVLIKGTTSGVETDFDGKYSIKAKTGDVLVFSFVGMKTTEKTIGSSNTINLTMATDNVLDEVVVTALGQSRSERALAFAAPKVKAAELNAAQNDNAISALSGKVAGLKINSPSGNIGGSQRILIRGSNSVTGENQPLFVIDGIPMDNSNFNSSNAQRGAGGVDFGSTINDIDPSNIETVTVLKGAAAALYGSRASNGVVLITTKTGKNSKKLGVSVSSSITFSEVAVLPDLQREYGGGSIIPDFDDDNNRIGRNGFAIQNIGGTEYMLVQYNTDESWGPKYNPNLKVLHWDAFDQASFPNDYLKPRAWIAPENDVDSFFKTGVSTNNTLTLTSASDKGSVLFSAGIQENSGIVPNTEVNRHFAKFSINQKLSDDLTAVSSINYVQTSGSRPVIGYDDNSVTQKFFQWGQRQLDYKRLQNYKNDDGTQRTWNRTAWNNSKPKYSDNPYWNITENLPTDRRTRVYGNASLNYQITDDLSIKGSVYADTYNFRNTEQKAIGSQAQSEFLERAYNFKEYNYEFTANYKKDFSDNFKLSALFGANKRNHTLNYRFNQTTGGLSVPNIYNINNGKGPLEKNADNIDKVVNSLFGSVSLSFANQLFIDLTGRNDWSSTLPEDNNSYFYPSASVAWVFNDVLFPNSNWFNYGKLRFGWAQVGNDTDPYRVISTLTLDTPFKGDGRVTSPVSLLNSDLVNETTTTWEVGTELNFLNRRVNLDVTYYSNETTDQIIPVDLSYGTGYGSQWINAGKMTNKGVEIQLGLKPIVNENFTWNIDVNFAKNENKLVELKEGLNSVLLTNAPFQAQLAATVGKAYGSIMGTDFIYDDQGNKVITSDGTYAATNDLVALGSATPDFSAGLRNSFKYKNFDLGILLEMSKGGKYFSTSHMWGMYSGMLQETVDNNIREDGIVLPGVTGTVTYNDDGSYTVTNTAPNTTKISGQTYGTSHYGGLGTPDAQNVFDADFYKIREVSLGYTFKGEFLKVFDKARVSLFGRNLYTWGLDYDGIDPETVSTGSGNIQGLEGGLQPSVRSFGMNLNLSF